MWQKPWGYKEGFAICGGLFLTGTFLQITIGKCELSILSYDFIYVFFSLYFVFY
ncbi:putative membrane protein [Bacteroides fragilis str. 3986 T(B)9]|uniref:Putative membrane protein n=1 Tax=Bacteroides fragilis (strain 638R) TaxID=862962 RepID=E1WKK2_BACF6|nr:putative membrane protein [Bacteroides fragilis str. 3774 T13]EXY58162.1 putative membrane protein [Bacteroides fragilis str. 3986T(B)10]EXY67603.1 putative membrane protein [Bacteroides fragilis str. 3986 T(B)9]EYA54753.1 putative membrane protein [Bacteroides fragilis str. 3986 N(B)22]EYA59195.1 putative membrane protein [Bacteroides fragilis str. 3986 T(B)13]EYA68765.1 putative membrane protein [Bacteroides fragilis str. S24L15]EYA77543.1 putative membrane protein [Bacteroides fragilis 